MAEPEFKPDADFQQEFSDERFWDKLKRYALSAGREVIEKTLLLYYAAQRPETPAWAKTVAYSALGYFILPTDAIPDVTPVVGYSDDLGALILAVATIVAYIDDDVRQKAAARIEKWFNGRKDDA
jgi:uncharacterized membrane protein YkvA (DUF1232 family)